MHHFIIGIFSASGKLVMALGNAVKCTHDQATLIVRILETANLPLQPGHFLAYDYQ